MCVDFSPHTGHLTCRAGVSSDVMHLQWKHKLLIFLLQNMILLMQKKRAKYNYGKDIQNSGKVRYLPSWKLNTLGTV